MELDGCWGAVPDGVLGGIVRAGMWRRQPRPDRGGRWGERGGLRSVPGPLPAGHGLLHPRLAPHGVPAAGRLRLAPWCSRQPNRQKLHGAQQRSRSAALPTLLGEPALEGQERTAPASCSGRVWGPSRVATSGRRQVSRVQPCRLPGAVPPIRRVPFQVSAVLTAHSAPARLQSTWQGCMRWPCRQGGDLARP